ncbi:hypothetical protein B1A99_31955 [Cohnella sp. CIP 111063]|uniref:ABC transporter permease n=1 Tax=unclassified Cohnella TaxID=2636738 RepID=UPI000B8BDCC9|nr:MULTISPECIES: ABC-2 family transporter protein [unclassified Cohnella]OXS52967.1 hypothetical protein B1A99_31955 [Cohnella sp. CIP 111063]PRX60224.1 ABC-2 type transport system permease protein [Cohnella sp. SGD-V74]
MRLYCQIMLNAVQSGTTYRFHTFITTANRLVALLVQFFLWTALYAGASALSVPITQVSLDEMITYAVFSTMISMIVANENIETLSQKIQTGNIVTYLIRPIGLFRSLLFETLGTKAFAALFEIIPILVVGYLFFSPAELPLSHLLRFLIALFNGFMVYFLLTFLVGMSSFWYLRIFHLSFVLTHLINFFSGIVIPIWFFPKALYAVTSWLPFDLIYYHPLAILLGKADESQNLFAFAKGAAWIAVLAAASAIAWMAAKRKVVVQGG